MVYLRNLEDKKLRMGVSCELRRDITSKEGDCKYDESWKPVLLSDGMSATVKQS